MNLPRIFANAVARRVAFVVVGAFTALLVQCFGEASAQEACPPSVEERVTLAGINTVFPDAESAVAACNGTGSPGKGGQSAGWHDRFSKGSCKADRVKKKVEIEWNHIGVWSSCPVNASGAESSKNHKMEGWPYVAECPNGGVWDEALQKCATECQNRPAISNRATRDAVAFCHDGCAYTPAPSSGTEEVDSVCFNTADVLKPAFCGAKSWVPNGASCPTESPDEPWNENEDTCRSTGGGFYECVDEKGNHCVTGAKGTTMCWGPSETGSKTNPDGTEGATRTPDPTQPTPPPNMENPTPSGPPGSTTINNNTYNSGGYNGSGNTGGQGPGTSGPGQGGSGGNGGNDDGEEDGPGAPGGGVGTLYEGNGKTMGEVVGAFQTRIANAPVATATTQFLSVSLSGSCPTWTLEESAFWPAMVMDLHCGGALGDALESGSYLLLAMAAFAAFRIAFY